MQWFVLGGIMMWPLLFISIIAVAIIIERLLFYHGCTFPEKNLESTLAEALQTRSLELIQQSMGGSRLLENFKAALSVNATTDREVMLKLAGSAILLKTGANIGVLGMLSRLAPLVGLLGTIFGMIITFSRISSTHGAVDMPLLAGGIWQALITTAAGLVIAIPCVFARYFFLRRNQRIAKGLQDIGNIALAIDLRLPGCPAQGGGDA